jgi:hypothetical protein
MGQLEKLKARKKELEASLTANSPAEDFRKLNLLNYKIEVAEWKMKRYSSNEAGEEFHVDLILNHE